MNYHLGLKIWEERFILKKKSLDDVEINNMEVNTKDITTTARKSSQRSKNHRRTNISNRRGTQTNKTLFVNT